MERLFQLVFISAKLVQRHRVFSLDVTAAMLVSVNIGTAAILVSPTNPPGIDLICVNC